MTAPRPGWTGWLDTIRDLPTTLYDLCTDVAEIRDVDLPALERLIMTAADTLASRIDAATNELAVTLVEIRAALVAATANADAATQAAVAVELAKLDGPVSRLEALPASETDPVPAPPVVEAPAEAPVTQG